MLIKFGESHGACNTFYTECNVTYEYTLYILYTLYTVYTLYILYTVYTVYNVYNVYTVWGGVQPQKTQKNPNPKWDFNYFWVFWVFWVFLEKGVESTYLNIPDHLRPTCFLHFFREISPGSDT